MSPSGRKTVPCGRVPQHVETSPAYRGQRISLDFKDADVHNVLRLLAEVSKLNIVATDDVKGKAINANGWPRSSAAPISVSAAAGP